jgi:hypothetical protein
MERLVFGRSVGLDAAVGGAEVGEGVEAGAQAASKIGSNMSKVIKL